MNKKVGFIGLGNMGLPMDKNLISAGFEVHCLDVKKDKENEVIEIGGKSGHTIPTLLKKVDIVLTSLPTPKVVESVYFGEEGLIDNSPENNILIDLSTISPELDNKIGRSEEHTSELQSRGHLVCRLLLEKKNFNHSQAM